MAAKKAAKKTSSKPQQKTDALVTVTKLPEPAALVQTSKVALEHGFQQLAAVLSDPNLPAPLLEQAWGEVKRVEQLVEDAKSIAHAKVIALVTSKGERVPDTKGTLRITVDGYEQTIHPSKTGIDSKKLEALLRTKGKNPELAMSATVVYKVDEAKAAAAVMAGELTSDELENCSYDPSWTVPAPKKLVKAGEES